MRTILHSDLNNFYASVESLYHPEYKGKPIAVCGNADARHGIILAKNGLAKAFGVTTGEQIWVAKGKCPDLQIVTANFERYRLYSKLVHGLYREYTDLIEPFGIDEAWLDVTDSVKIYGDGEKIAYEIKDRIKSELGLTVSIGVSYNKIYAKLGSDLKKPDAVTVISHQNKEQMIYHLPASELLYIGKQTIKHLNQLSIYTIGDLAKTDPKKLKYSLGKIGEMLVAFAKGDCDQTVNHQDAKIEAKSIGNGNTAPHDLHSLTEVRSLICVLSESIATRLRRHNQMATGVHLSIKDSDLQLTSKQMVTPHIIYTAHDIEKYACELFNIIYKWHKPVRAITITTYGLLSKSTFIQDSIFASLDYMQKVSAVEQTAQQLKDKWGYHIISRGIAATDALIKQINPLEDNTIHPIGFLRK